MTTQQKIRNIYDLLRKEYGVEFVEEENPTGADNIDIAVKTILKADGGRVGFIFLNLSANTMYLRPKETPTSSAGIPVDANGGSIVSIFRDDLTLPSKEWKAIAAADNSAFYLLTFRIQPQ